VRQRRSPIRDDRVREEEPRERQWSALPYSSAGLLQLQRTAGNRAVQRLIIGIQDMEEMAGKATTIFESTEEQKKRKEITESPGSEKAAVFPEKHPEAIHEGFKQFRLRQNEPLIIVGHGSAPTVMTSFFFGSKEILPTFGGFTPDRLATAVANAVPAGYNGLIYISGCDTAVRLDFKPGTSFIERFGDELFKRKPGTQPTIRGNMGEAATVGSSTETIEIPKAWIEKHPRIKQICQVHEGRYYVDSHTGGEAHYWPHLRQYQSIFENFL
jgi:hypothetical protein